MIYAGNAVRIKLSGEPLEFKDAETVSTSDLIYKIKDKAKEIWDVMSTITVKDGGKEVADFYIVDYVRGTIIFDTAKTRNITVSGRYVTTTTVGKAHKYSISEKCDLYDVTAFGDTYKKRVAGILEAEGKISDFDVIDNYYRDALLSGKPILIEISNFEDDTNPKRYWVILEDRETESAIDGVQDATISFKSYGRF